MSARVIGVVILLFALLLLVTPRYIFPVCGVGRYAPPPGEPVGHHACHGTLKAETALGIVAIPIGLLPLLWPRRKVLIGASLLVMVLAVFVVLFPTVITGICKVPTMPCRLGTLPALVIEGILFGITAAAGLVASRKLS